MTKSQALMPPSLASDVELQTSDRYGEIPEHDAAPQYLYASGLNGPSKGTPI
jgi:hypothetical protein